MTAKKDKEQVAERAHEPEREPTAAEREQQALRERNEAIEASARAALEAADTDVALRVQVGAQPTSELPAPEGEIAEAAARAAVEAARSEAGRDYRTPLDRELEAAHAEAARPHAERTGPVADSELSALRRALHATDPDDYARVDDVVMRAGETERGWSPEVTARHPDLVAATLAELAGADGPRRAALEGIDPTDRLALEDALREQGFHEVRKQNLINRAIRINAERLAAADGLRAESGPHAAAALDDAMASIRTQGGLRTPGVR